MIRKRVDLDNTTESPEKVRERQDTTLFLKTREALLQIRNPHHPSTQIANQTRTRLTQFLDSGGNPKQLFNKFSGIQKTELE